jgi:hypothetical protein
MVVEPAHYQVPNPSEPEPTIILLHSSQWVDYGTQNHVKFGSQTTGANVILVL